QVRGDPRRLLFHLTRRLVGGGTIDGGRPGPESPDSHGGLARVTVDHPDPVGRDAELVGDDLGPGGLVSLPARSGADDDRGRAVRIHPYQTRSVESGGEPIGGPGETEVD